MVWRPVGLMMWEEQRRQWTANHRASRLSPSSHPRKRPVIRFERFLQKFLFFSTPERKSVRHYFYWRKVLKWSPKVDTVCKHCHLLLWRNTLVFWYPWFLFSWGASKSICLLLFIFIVSIMLWLRMNRMNSTYEDLLSSSRPFVNPIPLSVLTLFYPKYIYLLFSMFVFHIPKILLWWTFG